MNTMNNDQRSSDVWLVTMGLVLGASVALLGFVYYTSFSAEEARALRAQQVHERQAQETRGTVYNYEGVTPPETEPVPIQPIRTGVQAEYVGPPRPTETPLDTGSHTMLPAGSTITCTDTDGGDEPFVAGQVQNTVDQEGGGVTSVWDTCVVTSGRVTVEGIKYVEQLNEQYCDSDNRTRIKQYQCEYGCLNAECRPAPDRIPTVRFLIDGESAVVHKEYGSTITLLWSSTYANVCNVNIYGTATETWNQRDIGLSGTKKLTIENANTSSKITVSCEGPGGTYAQHQITVYSQSM